MAKKVSASIMCADFLHLQEVIDALNRAAYDYIHFDVMDGSFYPDYLLGKKFIDQVRSVSALNHEYHLMIRQPERYVETLEVKPNDQIFFHYELCDSVETVLRRIKEKGCRAGIALNAQTPAAVLDPYYGKLDAILVMLIPAGQMGGAFQPHCLEKIREIRGELARRKLAIDIVVDGHVNARTIPRLKELGVDVFVGGSSGLFIPGASCHETIPAFQDLILT